MLELYDKVVRAAIIIKSGEVADSAETSMSNDELMGDFE